MGLVGRSQVNAESSCPSLSSSVAWHFICTCTTLCEDRKHTAPPDTSRNLVDFGSFKPKISAKLFIRGDVDILTNRLNLTNASHSSSSVMVNNVMSSHSLENTA